MKYSVTELYDNIFDFPRELGTGQCLVELSLTLRHLLSGKGQRLYFESCFLFSSWPVLDAQAFQLHKCF